MELSFFDENIPCLAACPVHTNAGMYVAAIADGDDLTAYLTARLPNPFASVCGRVCAAPCEEACRRGEIDQPIAIRALKRFVTEQYGVEAAGTDSWRDVAAPPPLDRPESVGIVGGGPAGLAAAHDLRRHGYRVELYEAIDRLGGMMLLGIPEYRLDRELLAAEIAAIVDLGVEVHFNTALGSDVTLTELRERHDAVLLAPGASLGRGLDIPGHEADGVFRAIEFLINVNQGFEVDIGGRVVVIGGGNVAMDAARTALRASAYEEARDHAVEFREDEERATITEAVDVARSAVRAGATEVTIVALEARHEMPAAGFEIEEAEIEGIAFLHRRGPTQILVDDGRVTGLETIGVESVFDDEGRFAPVFDRDDRGILAADTVILAIGQAVDVEALGGDAGPDISGRRTVETDPDTLATSLAGVFSAGDAAFGPRTLIVAVAEGRRAAASIHTYLGGDTPDPEEGEMITLEQFHRLDDVYDRIERLSIPSLDTERRVGLREVELGFTEEQARCEAQRCLRCFANILLDIDRCVLCALCSDVCPLDLISLVPAAEVEPGATGTALLLDERACIRCGLCIERCPTDALAMGVWTGVGVPRVGVPG
jgi:NADPH-dependent glutamate synthase beta subunit-like oxidoreductase